MGALCCSLADSEVALNQRHVAVVPHTERTSLHEFNCMPCPQTLNPPGARNLKTHEPEPQQGREALSRKIFGPEFYK